MFGGTVKLTPAGLAVIIGSVVLLILFYWSATTSRDKTDKISLKHLLQIGITLTEKSGEKIMTVHEINGLNQKVKGKTKEGVNEPVTDADLTAHRIIVGNLKSIYPKLNVISEEHEDDGTRHSDENLDISLKEDALSELKGPGFVDQLISPSELTVWVDPLDATKEFTENLLEYVTTMVCVAVRGRATIGIIHNPLTKETVWGWDGVAVSANIKPPPNSEDAPKHAIIVSKSHAGKVRDVVNVAFGNDTKVISAGGAGYKTLRVIRKAVDAYVHVTLIKKWDLCAANALLNALGGSMTTLGGQTIQYDVASGYENQGGLLATIRDHDKYLNLLKVFDPVS